MKRIFLTVALVGFSFFTYSQSSRPNIVYIMSDDHDDDAISAYRQLNPKTTPLPFETKSMDQMAREGILFRNAFVANSICSPVRATVLTGKFSHLNGIKDNYTPFDTSQYTFVKQLRSTGYQTAIIGKWHLHVTPSGFDHFSLLPGQGLYYSPRFMRASDTVTYSNGYATEEITRQTLDWIDKRDPKR